MRIGPNAALRTWRLGLRHVATGSQPILFDDGSVLACNGEIYNDQSLCHEMHKAGWPQNANRSDVEVIKALVTLVGWRGLDRLDGMFAGVLFDAPTQRFMLFRDRAGIKPLFYCHVNGAWVIASEAKALVATLGYVPAFDRGALAECLAYGHQVNPASSLYVGVQQLAPGEILELGAHTLGVRRRQIGTGWPATEESAWDELLRSAVQSTSEAELPPATFLSGGVDSSLIAVYGARSGRRRIERAVVARYEAVSAIDRARDETEYAKYVASWAGMDLIEALVPASVTWSQCEQVAAALEQPMFTSTTVTQYCVGAVCRASGMRCVLAGDGLDELFFGYERLRQPYGDDAVVRYGAALRPLPEVFYEELAQPWTRGEREEQTGLRRRLGEIGDGPVDADALRRFELGVRLPAYHLLRVDRVFMAHGVEVRTPFLRDRIVGAALRNAAKHYLGVAPKQPVRVLLAQHLLAGLAWRPKQRFSGPLDTWAGRWCGRLGDLTDYVLSSERVRAVCNTAAVERFLRRLPSGDGTAARGARHAVWGLVCLAAWGEAERAWLR